MWIDHRAVILLLAMACPAVATAQSSDDSGRGPVAGGHLIPAMVRGEHLKPPSSFYVGGYASSAGYVSATVHLYEHRQGGETTLPSWTPWVLREVGRDENLRIEWADGAVCPGVYAVQRMLADRFAPRFRQPRSTEQFSGEAGTPPGPPITLDGGSTVAIWGYAVHPDGAMGAMIITGQEGDLQKWARFASEQLERCWSPQPPAYVLGS